MKPAPGKAYSKKYAYGAPLGHFIAQPSKYAQRLLAVALKPARMDKAVMKTEGAGKAKVEWVKGRELASFLDTPLARRYRHRILDQLADLVADHIRLGVAHGDIHSENIVVSMRKMRRGRLPRGVRVRAIDYGAAMPLYSEMGEFSKKRRHKYFVDYYTDDYDYARYTIIPLLARDMDDRKKLNRYFEKKFLERVEGL